MKINTRQVGVLKDSKMTHVYQIVNDTFAILLLFYAATMFTHLVVRYPVFNGAVDLNDFQ